MKVYPGHLAWIPKVPLKNRGWVGDGLEEEERIKDDS